jgi:hypothetical protein
MLVASFQVEHSPVGLVVNLAQIPVSFSYCVPAGAGIKPDIQNVCLFPEFARAAFIADDFSGKKIFDGGGVPGFGPVVFKELDDPGI